MFEMFKNSIVLFMQGRLFQNPLAVVRQAAVGVAVTFIICVGLSKAGLEFWAAAVVAAFAGGGLQPWLFRNLKYR